MKQLYLDIKSKIQQDVPEITQVSVWNNQIQTDEEGNGWAIPFPCVLIEFIAPSEIKQLGGGVQVYDPLIINIHIGADFYNGDNMEENLSIFDLRTKIYKAMQKFEPNGAVALIRTNESQDFNHSNVYHFIQEYTTNYIDNGMIEPLNGLVKQPPINLQVDKLSI